MDQVTQVIGALLILTAFVLAQLHRLTTDAPAYLLLNLAGSAILAVVAAVDGDAGFLLLEGVWAAVSGYAVARLVLRPGQR